MLMSLLDPEGALRRRGRRLKRRVYQNKVRQNFSIISPVTTRAVNCCLFLCPYDNLTEVAGVVFHFRGLILCGILMAMTS